MSKAFKWRGRHTVLSILFATSIVAFMDRMVMSVAIPYIAADFKLTPWESGLVLGSFFASYSISQIPGGILADIFGVRKVATLALMWWSAFTAITGLAHSFIQIVLTRFVFGLGEGVFPACAFKTIAVWFPRAERATANAIKFAAGPLGSALSPLVVVWIMSNWGWRTVFLLLFVPGFLFALLFWAFVKDRPSESSLVSAEELLEIEGNDDNVTETSSKRVNLRAALREPQIIRYFVALFSFDVAYWGFSTWLPSYLVQARGFTMVQMGMAASLPFLLGTLGSILGGVLSDRYFRNARLIPICGAQLLAASLLYIMFISTSTIVLIVAQTLAGFWLNFFFTSFWALPMSTVPKHRMGVVSGVINMAGQIAAFVSPVAIGYLVGMTGGGFGATFSLLIMSIIISFAVVLTLPRKAGLPVEQRAR